MNQSKFVFELDHFYKMNKIKMRLYITQKVKIQIYKL